MLKVHQLYFNYNLEKEVLHDFNFTVKKGEHLCVMGESGCGKSTLLKAIYGLIDLKKGEIFWNDEPVLGPKSNLVPGFKHFKYVAQDFDLMPYISVSENIKKHLSRFFPEESEERTQELLEVIEMKVFEHTKVKYLSGGQKQRVAIARALAKEPQLLLLDEPFGQIDNFKKNSLRRNLFHYLKQKEIACIVATHDKNDALSFAENLLVIQNNRILKYGNAQEIYHQPKHKYIAALFDDVNEIIVKDKSILQYPHQIKIDKKGEEKAIVTNSFFKGNFWLIEAEYHQQKIYINYKNDLAKGSEIQISFTL